MSKRLFKAAFTHGGLVPVEAQPSDPIGVACLKHLIGFSRERLSKHPWNFEGHRGWG